MSLNPFETGKAVQAIRVIHAHPLYAQVKAALDAQEQKRQALASKGR